MLHEQYMFILIFPNKHLKPSGHGILWRHRLHIDRLRIEIEMTSLYDIFFQHHNDVVAIT